MLQGYRMLPKSRQPRHTFLNSNMTRFFGRSDGTSKHFLKISNECVLLAQSRLNFSLSLNVQFLFPWHQKLNSNSVWFICLATMNLNRPTRLEHRLSNAIQIFSCFMQIVKEKLAIKDTINHWLIFLQTEFQCIYKFTL